MEESKKAVYAALFGNLLIAIAKLIAAILGKSATMLAEAYHSFSDVGNQILLLIGLAQSKKEPDSSHPFGYGKEQFFYSFVVAMLLFGIAGILSLQEGIHKLLNPEPMHNLTLIFVVLGISVFFELIAFTIAYKELKHEMKRNHYRNIYVTMKETKDPTLLTVMFEDGLALASILIAALSISLAYFTHNPIYDALGSIIIGVMLMICALMLAAETKKLLVGESVCDSDKERITKAIMEISEVNEIVDLRTMHMGPNEVMLAAELNIKDGLTTDQAEGIIDKVEDNIKRSMPRTKLNCFIELEGPTIKHAPKHKRFGGVKRTKLT